MKNVTIRLVAGEPVTLTLPTSQIDQVQQALSETWRDAARHTLVLHDLDGADYVINPAHVVMMEIR